LAGLDDEQRAAAEAPMGPVVVIAGAGTGKTRTITARIAHLIQTGQVSADQVLAVTHSTKAAGEMRDRLTGLGAGAVNARTFHSAALRILRQYWGETGRGGDLVLIDNKYPLVRGVLTRLDKRDPSNEDVFDLAAEIGWAKASLIEPGKFARQAAALRRVLPREGAEITKIYRAYERAKDKAGVLDFEDLLVVTAELIATNPHVAEAVRAQYCAFVVDEYQDTDPAQQQLLDELLGTRDNLCVVGDPRQSIYQFKGADPGALGRFEERYPQAVVVRLVRDYRSTEPIVRAANALIPVSVGEALIGQRSGSEPLVVHAVGDEASEERLVVKQISELLASGVEGRQIAVLYRFNAQSARFEAALGAAGINYRVADAERFFERGEIRGPLRTFGQLARAEPDSDGLELLYRVLGEVGFDPDRPPAGVGAARSRFDAQLALVELLEESAQGAQWTARELLAEINRRASEAYVPTTDGVTLSTLHKAKGLEYDCVFLVNLTEGSLPSMYATSPAQLDEERRLLYVGITRARWGLWLSWSSSRAGPRGATWTARPSRFLEQLGGKGGRAPTRRRVVTKAVAKEITDGCAKCGGTLRGLAARRLGRCGPDCLEGDEAVLYAALAAWRGERRERTRQQVATDHALLTIVERRPGSVDELAGVAGLDKSGRSSWWNEIPSLCR
jgi:DNA helicase-2/ATP-dependent DNA helicase PcrA